MYPLTRWKLPTTWSPFTDTSTSPRRSPAFSAGFGAPFRISLNAYTIAFAARRGRAGNAPGAINNPFDARIGLVLMSRTSEGNAFQAK